MRYSIVFATLLMMALFALSSCRQSQEPPPTIEHEKSATLTAVEAAPTLLTYFCFPPGKFHQDALKVHKAELDLFEKCDWRHPDDPNCERPVPALNHVRTALAIDNAIALKALALRSPKSSVLSAAYQDIGPHIEELASSDWKTHEVSEVDAIAHNMARFANLVDQARVLKDHQKESSALAAAYKQHASTVNSVAMRPWQKHEMSGDEEAILDKVTLAYFIDAARAFQTGVKSTESSTTFLREFNQRSTIIGELAGKDWQKGQLSAEERSALCMVAESVGSQ